MELSAAASQITQAQWGTKGGKAVDPVLQKHRI